MRRGSALRALVTVPVFLLAILLISIGARPAPWGLGIVVFAIGLSLLLPEESLRATLHTDGVAHHKVGNPTGPAYIGAVLHSESGEVIDQIARDIGVVTNTVADYSALIEGLQMALDRGVGDINVYVDSPLVVGHLVEGYRVRADHLRPLVEHVRQQLDQFSSWSLTRVPRELNLGADRLAGRGMSDRLTRTGVGPRSPLPLQDENRLQLQGETS